MHKALMFTLLFLFETGVFAKSLGVVGSVFPVVEESFLSLIESRVNALHQNGTLDDINKDFIQRASAHADRPKPYFLKRATIKNTHFYTPEVRLKETLVDHKGRILYPAGTTVNALEKMPSYRPCWMFFNGDDKAQVAFIKKQVSNCQNPKLILTAGSVRNVEQALNAVIYFDQNARITQKINVQHLPAIVKRERSRLKITEYAIKENGDAV